MIYANNEQLATELKKVLLDKKISQRAISASMGISPQAFQNLLNKKQLSFSDMNKILSTIGYNLLVEYVPADTTQAPEMPHTATGTQKADKSPSRADTINLLQGMKKKLTLKSCLLIHGISKKSLIPSAVIYFYSWWIKPGGSKADPSDLLPV